MGVMVFSSFSFYFEGSHLAVLRALHSYLCTRISSGRLRGPYWMLEIVPGLAACKVSTLPHCIITPSPFISIFLFQVHLARVARQGTAGSSQSGTVVCQG